MHFLAKLAAYRVGWHCRERSPASSFNQVCLLQGGLAPQCSPSSLQPPSGACPQGGLALERLQSSLQLQGSPCVQGGLAAQSSLSRPGTPGGSHPGTPGGTSTPVTPFNANYVPQVGHSWVASGGPVAPTERQDGGDLHSCRIMHNSRHTRLAAKTWQYSKGRLGSRTCGAPACPLPRLTHAASSNPPGMSLRW